MSPTLTTFLFEAANFLVLVGLLAWLFFRPVKEALDRRQAEQQRLADEAAENLEQTERMRMEIEQRYLKLEQELDQRREQASLAAEKEAAEIIKQARGFARRESESAKRRIANLEQSQMEKLARVIAETAGASVDRLLREVEQPDLNHALTAVACREIRAFGGDSLAPVRVESARPLDGKDRDALLTALGHAGEMAEFHVLENLGMGLRVSTNRGLVDLSSVGLAKFAEHQLAAVLVANDITSKDATDD